MYPYCHHQYKSKKNLIKQSPFDYCFTKTSKLINLREMISIKKNEKKNERMKHVLKEESEETKRQLEL